MGIDIATGIQAEANKLISRHERRARLIYEERRRRARRSTKPEPVSQLRQPRRWSIDDGFNPYLARARNHRITHSISRQLQRGTYSPCHPISIPVRKADGGTRDVCIYQVADGAVSRLVYESLLSKNLPIFSSHTYAYRRDVSAQDAIQFLQSELSNWQRVYVADYDFSSYFDNIDHEHIRRTLRDHFLSTDEERCAIESFLKVGGSDVNAYARRGGPVRERGIPQGTSVSLLLANLAAWRLDRILEYEGVGFARYADDIVLWSDDYQRLCQAVGRMQETSDTMGVEINFEKSGGIRLLTTEPEAEMRSETSIGYLGYEVGLSATRISLKGKDRFKRRVGEILYSELLREPTKGSQRPSRIAAHIDRDYVSCIWRLRHYVYGGLSERQIARYLASEPPKRTYRGFVASYPLLSDPDELVELDGWLAHQVYLSIRKRSKLLAAARVGPAAKLPPPHGVDASDLLGLSFVSVRTKQRVDVRIPSLRRMARVITRAARIHGPSAVGQPSPHHY